MPPFGVYQAGCFSRPEMTKFAVGGPAQPPDADVEDGEKLFRMGGVAVVKFQQPGRLLHPDPPRAGIDHQLLIEEKGVLLRSDPVAPLDRFDGGFPPGGHPAEAVARPGAVREGVILQFCAVLPGGEIGAGEEGGRFPPRGGVLGQRRIGDELLRQSERFGELPGVECRAECCACGALIHRHGVGHHRRASCGGSESTVSPFPARWSAGLLPAEAASPDSAAFQRELLRRGFPGGGGG